MIITGRSGGEEDQTAERVKEAQIQRGVAWLLPHGYKMLKLLKGDEPEVSYFGGLGREPHNEALLHLIGYLWGANLDLRWGMGLCGLGRMLREHHPGT